MKLRIGHSSEARMWDSVLEIYFGYQEIIRDDRNTCMYFFGIKMYMVDTGF